MQCKCTPHEKKLYTGSRSWTSRLEAILKGRFYDWSKLQGLSTDAIYLNNRYGENCEKNVNHQTARQRDDSSNPRWALYLWRCIAVRVLLRKLYRQMELHEILLMWKILVGFIKRGWKGDVLNLIKRKCWAYFRQIILSRVRRFKNCLFLYVTL